MVVVLNNSITFKINLLTFPKQNNSHILCKRSIKIININIVHFLCQEINKVQQEYPCGNSYILIMFIHQRQVYVVVVMEGIIFKMILIKLGKVYLKELQCIFIKNQQCRYNKVMGKEIEIVGRIIRLIIIVVIIIVITIIIKLYQSQCFKNT